MASIVLPGGNSQRAVLLRSYIPISSIDSKSKAVVGLFHVNSYL